ncbi:hypothetical protein PROFUN_16051, partial [Planoprotostelium fungivorum]
AGERICSSDKEVPASIPIDLRHHSPAQEPTRNRESTTDIHLLATYTLLSNIYSRHENGNHSPEGGPEEENCLHNEGSAQDTCRLKNERPLLHCTVSAGPIHASTKKYRDLDRSLSRTPGRGYPKTSIALTSRDNESTQTQDNDELSATPTNTKSSSAASESSWLIVDLYGVQSELKTSEQRRLAQEPKIPQRQFLANNTSIDRDRLISRLRWLSVSTLKINNQPTGLDRQDSIIETNARDRQPLNKTRTPRHWDRDKGERPTISQSDSNATSLGPRQMEDTKRQELEWVKVKNSLIWIQHSLED